MKTIESMRECFKAFVHAAAERVHLSFESKGEGKYRVVRGDGTMEWEFDSIYEAASLVFGYGSGYNLGYNTGRAIGYSQGYENGYSNGRDWKEKDKVEVEVEGVGE